MAQQLKSLLNGSPELRPLLAKAQALADLQRHFVKVAPNYLAQCSQVVGLEAGTLSIAVNNATAAAKLRQLAPDLVIGLQNSGCEVSGIRVRVQVTCAHTAPRLHSRKLSNAAQDALESFGLTLADSPLKRALEKMLRR